MPLHEDQFTRSRWDVHTKRYVEELEAALRDLVLKATDHIIAGHPINSDALSALHEAKRVLTNR